MTQVTVLTHSDRPEASTIVDWASHAQVNRVRPTPTDGSVWLIGGTVPQRKYFLFNPGLIETKAMPFRQRMERVRSELERLRDGWAGEHSKAPSDQTLADVDQVLEAISSAKVVPEVDVDEDNGYITFRWQKADGTNVLSFVLRGKGQVTVVVTELGDVPRASSRQFPVGNDSAIVRFLNRDEKLMDLLGYA